MANTYLNEFDRFMVHTLKPLDYMRYGDDFICFVETKDQAMYIRSASSKFLKESLSLRVNHKLDTMNPTWKGVSYLGVEFWPSGHRLNNRMRRRIVDRLDGFNFASYEALVLTHEKSKRHRRLQWQFLANKHRF